jgi:hypothetical protein
VIQNARLLYLKIIPQDLVSVVLAPTIAMIANKPIPVISARLDMLLLLRIAKENISYELITLSQLMFLSTQL